MLSITATESAVNGNHNGTHNAATSNGHREYSHAVTVEELATRYNLKPQVVNGTPEYHGANFLEAGAEKDGFILNADGTAYDRKNGRRYTSREVEKLAGLAHNEYEPCCEYSQRSGATFNGNGNHAPKLSQTPKATPKPYDTRTLAKRGITPETMQAFGIAQKQSAQKGAYVIYPTFHPDGTRGRDRLKYQDPARAGKKNVWATDEGQGKPPGYGLERVKSGDHVLLVNGEMSVWSCYQEGITAVCTLGEGNDPAPVMKVLAERGAASVRIVLDNDTPGRNGTTKAQRAADAATLPATAHEWPQDWKEGADASDLYEKCCEDGRDFREALEALPLAEAPPVEAPEAASTREEKPRFELFTLRDMAKMPRPLWLVRGLLVEKTVSIISANSGCFKSFFALDMGLCVAMGRPFMGREVKSGTVVYVAAEGFYTLSERATAFAQHHKCELPENFYALKVPVNLGDPATVAAFADEIAQLAPALVVLDTLSQCAVGANENDNAQMANFIRGMMALCNRIGAHATVLHHNGKASGTLRGAGSIGDNADARITLERPEGDQENTVFVRCEKQRGRPFEPFALRGAEIVLPCVDEYGDAVTSLVFEPCGDEVAAKVEKHANAKRADKTRDALMEVFDRCAIEGAPFGGVKVGFWKEAVEACDPPPCKQSSFWSYRTSLEKDGIIEQCGTHNNSPLFRRKEVTPTTPTTPNWSDWSDPNSTTPEYSNNSNNPLGVGVVGVPSVVSANGVVGVREEKPKTKRRAKNENADSETEIAPALPEMPPPSARKKKNANADSEAYSAPENTPDASAPAGKIKVEI